MYFVPQKKGWYQRAVQVAPRYRYGATIFIATILGVSWFFVFNPWLESSIQYEHAAIAQLNQKQAEFMHLDQRLKKLESTADTLEQENNLLINNQLQNQKEQFAVIFDAAKKSALSIISFNQEREMIKGWKKKNYKQLVAQGTLDQCNAFLAFLSSSPHMIQCKELSLTRNEGSQFTLQCQLQCILLT